MNPWPHYVTLDTSLCRRSVTLDINIVYTYESGKILEPAAGRGVGNLI
jgi:hypothetical protein